MNSLLNGFRKKENKQNRQEAILEHVCDLLNTKKTFGGYTKDFGLDSYIYLGSKKEITKQMIQGIKDCLQTYEKRMHVIDIQPLPSRNRFLISFTIKCKIEDSPHLFHISFHHQKTLFQIGGDP